MTESGNGTQAEMAENASVAQAGEPQGLDEQGAPLADIPQDGDGTPTPEELDARDEAFSGPRKPMGPVDTVNPESVPEEPDQG